MWKVILPLISITSPVYTDDAYETALEERSILLKKGVDLMLGGDIVLSESEQRANKIIMEFKENEIDYGFQHPQYFNLSKHFFEYKDEVKKSELFKIIQKMPKGALLHAHDTGMLGPDYVLSLTYWDNLYVCFEEANVQFLFSLRTPTTACETVWQLMKDARYSSGDVKKFDDNLREHFTLVIDNPNEVHTDINAVWKEFQNYFIKTTPLFAYKPVWEQYFYDSLKAFREDKIMYAEMRSVLPELYDLYDTKYNVMDTAFSLKSVLDRFMNDYPDFMGAKLIYAPMRGVDSDTVEEYMNTARKLKDTFPDFFAGFDLVGQEDLGRPTKDFLEILSRASDDIDYFFHSGETNWYGTTSDENMIDAVVLNCRRIGHGYAIVKHPVLMEEVKKRNIALEVNVISNVVLKLVEDMRNHPLAVFLAHDLPVVLSSDDPGIWESEQLSHDFYVSFVGVASRHADLRLLKKLALNSLYYSTHSDKNKLLREFEMQWAKFIEEIIQSQR